MHSLSVGWELPPKTTMLRTMPPGFDRSVLCPVKRSLVRVRGAGITTVKLSPSVDLDLDLRIVAEAQKRGAI